MVASSQYFSVNWYWKEIYSLLIFWLCVSDRNTIYKSKYTMLCFCANIALITCLLTYLLCFYYVIFCRRQISYQLKARRTMWYKCRFGRGGFSQVKVCGVNRSGNRWSGRKVDVIVCNIRSKIEVDNWRFRLHYNWGCAGKRRIVALSRQRCTCCNKYEWKDDSTSKVLNCTFMPSTYKYVQTIKLMVHIALIFCLYTYAMVCTM